METTPPIQTLTDELLGEIEAYGCEQVSAMQAEALIAGLRTLRAENAAHVSCIAMQLLKIGELRKDAARLQFVIEEGITISQMNGTGTPMVYQCQWHDCRQIDWYSSAIEAIDAAIAMEQAK